MPLVAVRMTNKILEGVDELVAEGVYASRSEAMRDAGRLILNMHRGIYKGRGKPVDRDKLVREYFKERGFDPSILD